MNDVEYKQDKPLCNKESIERYGYSYKHRNKSDRDNKQTASK